MDQAPPPYRIEIHHPDRRFPPEFRIVRGDRTVATAHGWRMGKVLELRAGQLNRESSKA